MKAHFVFIRKGVGFQANRLSFVVDSNEYGATTGIEKCREGLQNAHPHPIVRLPRLQARAEGGLEFRTRARDCLLLSSAGSPSEFLRDMQK
jgi:hypothetical protein